MSKKTLLLLLLLLFPTSYAVVTLSGEPVGHASDASPEAASAPEVGVVTLAPQRVTVSTVLPGRTSAFLMAEVRPQVGGILQKRLFEEGGDVKAGEVLYQIDPARYQAAYNNAKAALAKAEASAVPINLKATRSQQLIREHVIAEQDNDEAQAASRNAAAEIAAFQAALESARIDLYYTKVTAPISGRIGKSAFTAGALVTANQAQPLSTIQQIDPLYVDLTQPSREVLRLKREFASGKIKQSAQGKPLVKLLLEDGTPYPHMGELQFSDITVDPSTGVITLRVIFPNPSRELLPGMYVRAVLDEGVEDNALLVPQQAVTRDPKGVAMVMVLSTDSVIEQRIVEIGRAIDDKWVVLSGLAAGDKIVVDGLQKVKPGTKVKAVTPEKFGQDLSASRS